MAKHFYVDQESIQDDLFQDKPFKALIIEITVLIQKKIYNGRKLKARKTAVRLNLSKATLLLVLFEHFRMN